MQDPESLQEESAAWCHDQCVLMSFRPSVDPAPALPFAALFHVCFHPCNANFAEHLSTAWAETYAWFWQTSGTDRWWWIQRLAEWQRDLYSQFKAQDLSGKTARGQVGDFSEGTWFWRCKRRQDHRMPLEAFHLSNSCGCPAGRIFDLSWSKRKCFILKNMRLCSLGFNSWCTSWWYALYAYCNMYVYLFKYTIYYECSN